MAVDVCSEIPSLSISPRISFSHDLNQPNLILLEDQDHHHHHQHHHDRRRLDSSSDFDFCIVTEDDFTFEISSADELFSNGKILPVEIKTKEYHNEKLPNPPQPNLTSTVRVINNNSSSTNLKEKKPIINEYNQKIPSQSNLFSTSTLDNSNSTSLDKQRIKLKLQKHNQNPSLLTNTVDYSNSIGLDEKRINLKNSNQYSTSPDEKRIKLKNFGQTSSPLTSTARVVNSSSTGPEKKITRLKELLSSSIDTDDDDDEEEKEKTRRNSTGAHKPFWQFRRSSSLNFEKIKSLHFMYSRSNSTGSVRPAGPPNNPKPKPGLRKQQSLNSSAGRAAGYYKRTSSFSGGANNYYYNYGNNNNNNIAVSSKGNFPKKSNSTTCGAQYYHGNNINNGFRVVSPVLNLPQPYISKVTVSFFGFGSLFCNGKLRKKKK